jgi:hypothetical protein
MRTDLDTREPESIFNTLPVRRLARGTRGRQRPNKERGGAPGRLHPSTLRFRLQKLGITRPVELIAD